MTDWTICGHCNERVKCKNNSIGMVEHACEIIQSLKKNFNSCLVAIQRDTEDNFKFVDERISKLEHDNKELLSCDKSRADTLTKALVKIYKLEERLKEIEVDKGSSNVMINSIHENITKRLAKVEKEFELLKHPQIKVNKTIADLNALDGTNPKGIVFNEFKGYGSDKSGNLKRVVYKFADGRLDTIEKQDVHHPSRQHLEKTLAAKNQRIKELEHQLGQRNNECQIALNDLNSAKKAYDGLLKSWQSLNRTVLELKIGEDRFKSSPYGGGCYI